MEKDRIALARYRLEKSYEKLKSAIDLLNNEDYADSLGRSYYAIFSATRAILALKGLDSRKHTGVISLFNRNFVKTGVVSKELSKIIESAKINREKSDYGDFVEVSREMAEHQIGKARGFIKEIEKAINILIGNEGIPK